MKFDTRDVPCDSCCKNYTSPHECDCPDYCPCDKPHEEKS